MSLRVGENNKLVICKTGYPNSLLLTYINHYDKRDYRPVNLSELSSYLKDIYSSDGLHFQIWTSNVGDKEAEKVYESIKKKLCVEYGKDEDIIKKQLEDNIDKKNETAYKKITKKDANGKAIKEDGKYVYETDEKGEFKKEEISKTTKKFKKLLYSECKMYYKDNAEFKCLKLYGVNLSITSFIDRINSVLDESFPYELYKDESFVKKSTKKTSQSKSKKETNKNATKVNLNSEQDNSSSDIDSDDTEDTKPKTKPKPKEKEKEKEKDDDKKDTKGKGKKEDKKEDKKETKGKGKAKKEDDKKEKKSKKNEEKSESEEDSDDVEDSEDTDDFDENTEDFD